MKYMVYDGVYDICIHILGVVVTRPFVLLAAICLGLISCIFFISHVWSNDLCLTNSMQTCNPHILHELRCLYGCWHHGQCLIEGFCTWFPMFVHSYHCLYTCLLSVSEVYEVLAKLLRSWWYYFKVNSKYASGSGSMYQRRALHSRT